jgi:hypothetical protein
MKNILFYSAILSSFLLAGCGGATETNNNSAANRSNAANTNTVAANSKTDPLAPQTPTPESTTNNAPTLAPVYKAYCSALEKRDEAALRKVHDTATIADYERKMKADGVRALSDFLSDDKASSVLCEVRNEKISGDTGTAEVRTMGYPAGAIAVFAKENGEWKLTNRRPQGALQ